METKFTAFWKEAPLTYFHKQHLSIFPVTNWNTVVFPHGSVFNRWVFFDNESPMFFISYGTPYGARADWQWCRKVPFRTQPESAKIPHGSYMRPFAETHRAPRADVQFCSKQPGNILYGARECDVTGELPQCIPLLSRTSCGRWFTGYVGQINYRHPFY